MNTQQFIKSAEPFLLNFYTQSIKSEPTMEHYYVMYTTDETVASAVNFLVSNVFMFWGDYVHPNTDVTRFVNENFENMDVSLITVLKQVVNHALVYGYCASEIVWELKDGKYYLKSIVPLHPLLTSVKVENDKIIAYQYMTDTGVVEIPPEKVFLFKIGQGRFGKSSLRSIYRLYVMKRGFIDLWATAMERYAMPLMFARGEQPDKIIPVLKTVWSNGIVATENPNFELRLLETDKNVTTTFMDAIEYLNMLIYRGLFLPQLLASVRSTGTYSLGKVHFEMFSMVSRQLASQLAEAFIDSVVSKILIYNFEQIEKFGQITITEQPAVDERFKFAQAIQVLVSSGVIDPIEDNEWIRNMMKFPVLENKKPSTFEEVFEKLKNSQNKRKEATAL